LYKLVYKQATNFFFPISLIITLEVICTLDNALGEKKKGSKWGDATSKRRPYNIILMWRVENFTS